MLLKHEVCQAAGVSKYCGRVVGSTNVLQDFWGKFCGRFLKGSSEYFCSSALSMFLIAVTPVGRIKCFKVVSSFWMLFSVTSPS